MLRLLILAVLLFSTAPAWATTYYVSTAVGASNSNSGLSDALPFRSIQRCIDAMTVAGDTCTVADGTYTAGDVTGGSQAVDIVGYVRTSNTHGTAALPMTIKSTNYLGATVTLPSTSTGGHAFHLTRNNWIIQGFNITSGASPNNGSSTAYHGVVLTTGSDGSIVRRNHIHDIGRTVCSQSGFGYTGVFTDGGSGNLIEYNWIHAIGRLRSGESGCSTNLYQNDHAFYLHGGSNLTIQRNVIYDANRGFAIQFSGGTVTNTTIVNNTFSGHATENTGAAFCQASSAGLPCPRGHIVFNSNITTATIKNNIFYDPFITGLASGAFSRGGSLTSMTGVTYDYNYTNDATSNFWSSANGGKPSGATDGGHNLVSQTNPFVSFSTNDFTIASGASVIAAGTTVSGVLCNGTCDIGSFETWSCNATATVNGNALDTTCAMNLNTPVLPATGITGMTALVGAVPRTTTSSAKLTGTDSVVRTLFQGAACAGGQTWTNTYVPGNLTDSALIGGSLNQKAFAYTAFAVTNGCGGATGPTFTPVASSSFTGSDENPLSETSAWTTGGVAGTVFKRATNTALSSSFSNDSHAYYTGVSFNADQYSTADITTVSTAGGGVGQGLCVRCSTSPDSKYAFHIDHAASNNAELSRKVSGTFTRLTTGNCTAGNPWTQAFTNADTFTLAVAAEVVYVYDKTSTLVNTCTDTGGGVPNSGSPGLSYSSSTSSGTFADNWIGGNFSIGTPPPPVVGTLEQKTHQFTQSQLPGNALGAVGAANTNIRRGTSFALVTQTDCTVSACDSVGERLYFRRNSGAYAPVPDALGPDQIAYLGNTSDSSYLSGPITCCLSGALTANTGGTQFTSAAVPVFTLAQNASIVQRRQLILGASAILNDTYEFIEYIQTNQALPATPAGGAKITVTPATTISAPTNLASVGASSNTLIDLVWAPSTDVAWAGYNVYGCTATPCTLTIGTRLAHITPATAAAAHTTTTQFRTAVAVSGTYYFVVTAFDSGGQESVVSNEVAVVRTGFTAPAVRVP